MVINYTYAHRSTNGTVLVYDLTHSLTTKANTINPNYHAIIITYFNQTNAFLIFTFYEINDCICVTMYIEKYLDFVSNKNNAYFYHKNHVFFVWLEMKTKSMKTKSWSLNSKLVPFTVSRGCCNICSEIICTHKKSVFSCS